MTVNTSIHTCERVKADNADYAIWIEFQDDTGSDVTIFVNDFEMLDQLDKASARARKMLSARDYGSSKDNG